MDILKTFLDIYGVYGPSGREHSVSQKIAELAKDFSDDIYSDALGNLVVHKKGNGRKIMVSAHMDTIGFAVTYIDDGGYLRFAPVGGIMPQNIAGCRVVFQNGVKGVVCMDETADMSKLSADNFYIDIFSKDREDTLSKICIGDFAVFDTAAFTAGDYIVSSYLDNRIGCAVLLRVISEISANAQNSENDLYFVFTVQEEVGTRGASAISFAIDPELAINIDVTDCGEIPSKKVPSPVKTGKGPAIKIMDGSIVANLKVIELLRSTAEELGIEIQNDVITAGGTDSGTIQKSRGGVFTGGVSVPCRYMHGTSEAVCIRDAEASARLIAAALLKQ